ncbi:homoserine dehydrogenase [Saccharomycopsis crataegensis]|uniref:Homoserine dehydrogenase n=1 Tax=Saccharomycopsis crataegensis TaxID=43959 RepID=A0AAV5QNE3_9ASCO|nr:homoserine dehydrogenase [Saccharomycopsis crataegensis]
MVKTVNIAIIGPGLVGSEFINQLANIKSTAIKYNSILISSSKKALISQEYKPLNLSSWSEDFKNTETGALSSSELLSFLTKSVSLHPTILVDNSSSVELSDNYPKILEAGVSIATPNKKAFSGDISLWNAIFGASATKGSLVYHEATVGAGLPVISTIKDLIATGDEIEEIEGIFSGSLSYIFNELYSSGKKYSEIVTIAKSLGYTEPDPRDDLNGQDFARKVLILSRLSGFEIKSLADLKVDSLIPADLEDAKSGSEFLVRLPNYDQDIESLKEAAAKEGKVVKYTGKIDIKNKTASVGIQKYDKAHPFANMSGSDNVISIKTKRYTNPLIIQGAGAGAAVTAAGVLADTIKIAERS